MRSPSAPRAPDRATPLHFPRRAEHHMGMPAPSKPKRWTAAMVREFPDDGNRYEVIDGVLLVTPAPRRVHQRAVARLQFALDLWISGQDIGELLPSPADLELEPDDLVQPD